LITINQWMKYFLGILLVIIFIISANVMSGLLFPNEPMTTSRTPPDPEEFQAPPITVSQIFPFENIVVNVTFSVNVSLLEKMKKRGRVTSTYSNNSVPVETADIYRAMVNDPDQEQAFSDLHTELDKVRHLQKLSDDEYLELTSVYVQSLRYESLNQNFAKMPVETIVDGAGDCDDKSLLLAGLLAREGYSVALLSFEPEAHMAVGVRSNDYLYKDTGYSFIETTDYSFVGVPTDKLVSNLTLYSDPAIIIISNGTKIYTSGNETQYIHDNYLITGQKVKELAPQLKQLNDELMEKRSRISELESNIAQLKNSDNIKEYNSQVSAYTTLTSVYNNRLDSYTKIYSEYEKFAVVNSHIFGHKFDRKGVYDYVKNYPS
jgi:hypothetical protein